MWRFRRPPVRIERVPFEEEEAFLQVVANAFGIDPLSIRTHFYEDPYYPYNQRWGLWVEEGSRQRLVSVLTVVPLEMWVGDRLLPCVGIAGVGTYAPYRRRGYAGQLLTSLVRALHQQGVPLAILQAFHHGFYRRYGWETVGTLGRVRVSPAHLSQFPALGVRRALPSDYPAMQSLHAQLTTPKTGMLERDTLRWEYLFWNFRHKWVYEIEGQIEGYMMYDFLEGGSVLRIREILWATERARQALFGWLARNEERVRWIEFNGTLEELLHLRLPPLQEGHDDPEKPLLQYELMPGFMARVVEVPSLLSHLLSGKPIPEGFTPFTLQVQDPILGAHPPVAIMAEEGSLTVQQGRVVEPVVALSASALAQLVLGAMEALQLFLNWKLALPPNLRRTLESLFPFRNPCLRPIDFF